jgi:hypothetical protein
MWIKDLSGKIETLKIVQKRVEYTETYKHRENLNRIPIA